MAANASSPTSADRLVGLLTDQDVRDWMVHMIADRRRAPPRQDPACITVWEWSASRRATEHGSGLAKLRWVVERTWLAPGAGSIRLASLASVTAGRRDLTRGDRRRRARDAPTP